MFAESAGDMCCQAQAGERDDIGKAKSAEVKLPEHRACKEKSGWRKKTKSGKRN
jgi:hypothetical protein